MNAAKFTPDQKQLGKNIVGQRVRVARGQMKPPLTQDQLSGRIARLAVSLDRAAIAKIELGQRKVNDFEVVALARSLKVDVRWLLGIDL